MEALRIGSLNINGGRDSVKRAIVYETIEQKKLDIVFLQETHSDLMNEVEWNLWWKGHKLLSHGTNLSRGVGIFSLQHKGGYYKYRGTSKGSFVSS